MTIEVLEERRCDSLNLPMPPSSASGRASAGAIDTPSAQRGAGGGGGGNPPDDRDGGTPMAARAHAMIGPASSSATATINNNHPNNSTTSTTNTNTNSKSSLHPLVSLKAAALPHHRHQCLSEASRLPLEAASRVEVQVVRIGRFSFKGSTELTSMVNVLPRTLAGRS